MTIKEIFLGVVAFLACMLGVTAIVSLPTGGAIGNVWGVGVLALTLGAASLATKQLQTAVLHSAVEGHEGPCLPSWLDRNQGHIQAAGAVTGYFQPAVRVLGLPLYRRKGTEFHGYVSRNLTVMSTAGHYLGHLD